MEGNGNQGELPAAPPAMLGGPLLTTASFLPDSTQGTEGKRRGVLFVGFSLRQEMLPLNPHEENEVTSQSCKPPSLQQEIDELTLAEYLQMPGPVQRAFHLLAHLIFTTSLEVVSGFMPILQMKILRNSDSRPLAQSPKAGKKWSQRLNPGSPSSEFEL